MEAVTMIKAAALAAQNKNNIGKILTILLGILLAPLILILMVYVQVMSAFSPDGLLQSPDAFDGANSAVYQSIHAVTDPFYEEIDTQLDAAESDIQRYSTYVYDIIDDQGRTQTVRDEPGITKKRHYISESVIIAYLLQTDGAIDTATGYINEEVTKNFLHSICTVTSSNVGDNNWIVENKILTINQIAELYFPTETEQTRYKFACNAYSEYFDVSESEVDGADGIDRVFDANLAAVPLYLQYDPTWGGISYGNGTIRKNGCCPTCLAMVFSYMRGETIYPSGIVAWAGNRYYVNGSGTSWNIFEPAAAQWGVTCRGIGKDGELMQEALSQGKLVVASMGPGTFTRGGHFIVLTGITDDGKIKVNDPNDNSSKQHINQAFAVSLILRESKAMWVFE